MKTTILYTALIFFSLTACNNGKSSEELEPETGLIEITKDQFLSENMKFGTPVQMLFSNSFHVSGKIVSDVNGTAKISVPVEGVVKKALVKTGQLVKAGEGIIEVGGNTLIDLQQSFASSAAKIKQLKSDYDRINALYKENIRTENEFMLAESGYKSELAIYSALKLKLENIGLNTATIEKGIYASSYKIKSPIAGQVADITISLGQFVSHQQDIAEIVNVEKTLLQLAVFERDYSNLSLRQKVLFRSAGEKKYNSTASVTQVSRVLNPKSKSFNCFAEIAAADKKKYIINQLVRGDVILTADSVYAIAQDAVLKLGNNNYVFVKNSETENGFSIKKLKVKVGRIDKGFVELLGIPKDEIILISGAYYVSAE